MSRTAPFPRARGSGLTSGPDPVHDRAGGAPHGIRSVAVSLRRHDRRGRTCPRAGVALGGVPRGALPSARDAGARRRARSRVSRARRAAVGANQERRPRPDGRDGRSGRAARTRSPVHGPRAVRGRRRGRACRAARAREPGEERPLSDDRTAVGVRGHRPGDIDRLHAGVQPLDRRLLSSDRWPPGADRAPHAARPRGGRGGAGARGRGRLPRGLPGAVHAHQEGTRARGS